MTRDSERIEVIEAGGDIFASGCQTLVNPVDAMTGAQGAGLAKAFKLRWPAAARRYKIACLHGRMQVGGVMLDTAQQPILFVATKDHWRSQSRIEWVERCLDNIVSAVEEAGIKSIAIPALGCGLGGLDWRYVRPLTLAAAQRMSCERVVLYGPGPKGRGR